MFRCLGWASIHRLERVAGATAAAVVVLVSTNGTVAGMDEGGGPSSPTVLDAFTESVNSGSVERSQALLADDAVSVDHDGQHAGAPGRLAMNPPLATATTVAVVVPASCFSVALCFLLRRVRKRGRITVQPPRNLLQHLHEATIQQRMAIASAAGQGGSDPGSAAHLHAAKSARP